MNGEIEINEPVRVYDTSGPWGDPDFHGDVTQGLPPLRAKWIRERGDVEKLRVERYRQWMMGISPRNMPSMRSAQWKLQIPRSEAPVKRSNLKLQTSQFALAPKTSAREVRSSCYATGVRQAWHHHARNGIHRDSRESWPRS